MLTFLSRTQNQPADGEAPDAALIQVARRDSSAFVPLDPLARRLTFNVPAVLVGVSDTAVLEITVPAAVTLEPPDGNPTLPPRSESWPVNIPMRVAGYDLVFSEAWLQEVNPGQMLLHIETGELSQPAHGPWLRWIHIDQVLGPSGPLPESEWTQGPVGLFMPSDVVRVVTSDSPSAAEPEPPRTYRAGLSIELNDSDPAGTYRLEISGVAVQMQGPWRIPVDLP